MRCKLRHAVQRFRHMDNPGIALFPADGKRHVPGTHPWVTAFHAVCHLTAGALDQEQGQMSFGIGEIARVKPSEHGIGFYSCIELFHEPEVRLVTANCLVNHKRLLHLRNSNVIVAGAQWRRADGAISPGSTAGA